ncbi:ParB N-terminal domain-containing protein [Chamaesiphon polymorphus]|uniref:ParB-like N-terminal domain-containing protein n=1 Tax=Chamaesiphon polymorphus CCALA 037 TaxID=2107692 RepID=A0A2T1GI25_9CYAN|nr:ParB N-terminal domain-containing protein [Chamaesiphon polymorphus]PSB57361.1 hypothetical protein C7B77_08600 [Chamaesiphon polymorphus CCALA 037]
MIKCYFIEIQSIESSQPKSNFKESEIEKLADSILETDALIRPLIVQNAGNEKFAVIEGHLEYYAAVRAREKNPIQAEEVNAFVIPEKVQNSAIEQLSICDNHLISRKQSSAIPSTANLIEPNPSIDNLTLEVSVTIASHVKPILDRLDRQEKALEMLKNKQSEQIDPSVISQQLQLILAQLADHKVVLDKLQPTEKVKITGINKKILDFRAWCEQMTNVTQLDNTLYLINTLTEEQLILKMKQSTISNGKKLAHNIIDKRNTQVDRQFDNWETIFNAEIGGLGEATIKKIIEKLK